MDVSSQINTAYSRVIYEYAEKNQKLDEIYDQVHFVLDTLIRDDQLVYKTLRNYNILKQYRKDFLKDLFKNKIDDYLLFTLETIVDFNRCSYFLTIIKQTLHLLAKTINIRYVKVFSAFELTDIQIQKLREALKNYYNANKVDIKNIVNPSIIGGLKIVSDEDSINTSYISKLINIREQSINSLSRHEQKEDK